MVRKVLFVFFAIAGILLSSCGKRNIPSKSARVPQATNNTISTVTKKVAPEPPPAKPDTVSVAPVPEEKPVPKPQPKPDFPNVISVNDNAARKSVDGRLFYDVLGHRYWKNYSDGKYYLFDKSMYNNPDFQPPKN